MTTQITFPTDVPARLDEFLAANHDMHDYYPIANNHRVITGFIHRDELDAEDAVILKRYVVINGFHGNGHALYGSTEQLADRLHEDTSEPSSSDRVLYNELFTEAPNAFSHGYPHAVAEILGALDHVEFRIAITDAAYDRNILPIHVLQAVYRVINHY